LSSRRAGRIRPSKDRPARARSEHPLRFEIAPKSIARGSKDHQGVVALAAASPQRRRRHPSRANAGAATVKKSHVLLDGVEIHTILAPYSNGACLRRTRRSHPERRSDGLTDNGRARFCQVPGALAVAKITNLAQTMQELKEAATAHRLDETPQELHGADYTSPVGIVLGVKEGFA